MLLTQLLLLLLLLLKKRKRNLNNLVKKNDCNTKISEIEKNITTDHDHCIYITTQEFDKLLSETFTERLKQANVARKVIMAIS